MKVVTWGTACPSEGITVWLAARVRKKAGRTARLPLRLYKTWNHRHGAIVFPGTWARFFFFTADLNQGPQGGEFADGIPVMASAVACID